MLQRFVFDMTYRLIWHVTLKLPNATDVGVLHCYVALVVLSVAHERPHSVETIVCGLSVPIHSEGVRRQSGLQLEQGDW